ncbi:MAG: hypothetical protein RTS72_00415 [Candidatus Thorarchaeota archaeon]
MNNHQPAGGEQKHSEDSTVDDVVLTAENLQDISNTPSVRILYLDELRKSTVTPDLDMLAQCERLEKLIITMCYPERWDLTPLSRVSSLREVILKVDGTGTVSLDLGKHPSLKRLVVGYSWDRGFFPPPMEIMDLDLQPLTTCKSLEDISIMMTGHMNQYIGGPESIDLTPLVDCEKLEGISISLKFLKDIIFPESGAFSHLHALKLINTRIRSVELDSLGPPSDLIALEVSYSLLKNVDLSILEGCTTLKVLRLNSNRLESIDLSPLQGCTSLHRLQLQRNRLQTVDLSPLSDLPDLGYVFLEHNSLRSIDTRPLQGKTWSDSRNDVPIVIDIDYNPIEFLDGEPF